MRCEITTTTGELLAVDLERSDARDSVTLFIDGLPCHLERLPATEAQRYLLDADPDYTPQTDAEGFTFVLVPYSRG